MENVKSENRIFGSYKPKAALMLIFSVGILIGALTPIFFEVPVFCGIALFVVAGLIFMTAREIIPVCGILLPALLELMTTGSLSLPAVYVGAIFAIAATAYVTLVGRWYYAFGAAVIAYACGAFALDPTMALIAPVCVFVGFLFALMLPRYGIGATAGISTALLTAGGVALLLLSGADLAVIGEDLRTSVTGVYMSLNDQINIIEESTAEMLAAYFVNILPSLVFAAVSVACYLAATLTVSFLSSSGLGEEIPEDMRTLTLAPANGFVFIFSFFLAAAFSIEGGEYELWATVFENIVIALALPFTAVGTQTTHSFFLRKVFVSYPNRRKLAGMAIVLIFIITSSIAFAFFMALGVTATLKPFFTYISNKIKSKNNR